ncbi:unnamed protein product [Protopolystoma xenopodis]|uniref:Uncharacterized protein n=1 Tax=Protopolystoma xenopodis TaxID=117903 RepID=A0A3S5A8Q9_9PLAT|nr:unnamed protein product [Protopolystoma xenopodis]
MLQVRGVAMQLTPAPLQSYSHTRLHIFSLLRGMLDSARPTVLCRCAIDSSARRRGVWCVGLMGASICDTFNAYTSVWLEGLCESSRRHDGLSSVASLCMPGITHPQTGPHSLDRPLGRADGLAPRASSNRPCLIPSSRHATSEAHSTPSLVARPCARAPLPPTPVARSQTRPIPLQSGRHDGGDRWITSSTPYSSSSSSSSSDLPGSTLMLMRRQGTTWSRKTVVRRDLLFARLPRVSQQIQQIVAIHRCHDN